MRALWRPLTARHVSPYIYLEGTSFSTTFSKHGSILPLYMVCGPLTHIQVMPFLKFAKKVALQLG